MNTCNYYIFGMKQNGKEEVCYRCNNPKSEHSKEAQSKTENLPISDVRASVCGYCGRLLGNDNYPKPFIQGMSFEIPDNAEKVEGSCCIARERLGAF